MKKLKKVTKASLKKAAKRPSYPQWPLPLNWELVEKKRGSRRWTTTCGDYVLSVYELPVGRFLDPFFKFGYRVELMSGHVFTEFDMDWKHRYHTNKLEDAKQAAEGLVRRCIESVPGHLRYELSGFVESEQFGSFGLNVHLFSFFHYSEALEEQKNQLRGQAERWKRAKACRGKHRFKRASFSMTFPIRRVISIGEEGFGGQGIISQLSSIKRR